MCRTKNEGVEDTFYEGFDGGKTSGGAVGVFYAAAAVHGPSAAL
jgi:hypothetical protein